VDVLEFRPKTEVPVGKVEEPRVRAKSKPRIVETKLHSVRVLADHEFLPGPATKLGTAPGPLVCEPGLGLGAKALTVGLQLSPPLRFRDELAERNARVALLLQLLDDPLLDGVERRRLTSVAFPARSVRQHVVVQLVRRDDPATLEAGGDAMDPGG